MKENKLLLLLFLLVMFCNLKGQSYDKKQKDKSNSIIFAPINLFDFVNPSLQLGYERMLNKKYAVQVELAYITNHSIENYLIDQANGIKDCEYTNKGFKIREEFKYYFYDRDNLKYYLSGELFYLKNRSKVLNTFVVSDTTFVYSTPRPPGHYIYNDFFTIDKQRFGLNLKIGLKYVTPWNVFIEPHLGIGIVYRISRHYDRENMNDELSGGFINLSDKAGNMWLLNLPINIKLGYCF